VHANFVSAAVGLCDLNQGEEGVLFSPDGGCLLIFEDDGEDEEFVVSEGYFVIDGQAEESLSVLKGAYNVHVEQ
jgi:hypothetical protein